MDKTNATRGNPGGAGGATERHRTAHGSVEFRTHAADLSVELRGHSAQDLFHLAAWALAHRLAPGLDGDANAEDTIELEADGWDDLLVNWMNQLLFLTERHHAVWTEMEFRRLTEAGLTARVRGWQLPETYAAPAPEVSAASYVGLELVPGPSLWMARVKLDL
jgi:SHS2 domain-containing protein